VLLFSPVVRSVRFNYFASVYINHLLDDATSICSSVLSPGG